MRSLVFFIHAGGVAKTSSVRNLGYALAERGHSVLLIDADPQANLTEWLGVMDEVPLEATTYPAVIGAKAALALPPSPAGPRLRPHPQPDLARLDRLLLGEFSGVARLRSAVRKLSGYDFVLIDLPPSLGQRSALCVVAGPGGRAAADQQQRAPRHPDGPRHGRELLRAEPETRR